MALRSWISKNSSKATFKPPIKKNIGLTIEHIDQRFKGEQRSGARLKLVEFATSEDNNESCRILLLRHSIKVNSTSEKVYVISQWGKPGAE